MSRRKRRVDREALFWAKVDRRGEKECWEWTGHRDADNYGQFCGRGAHRFSLGLALGRPVGRGVMVLHSCNNPPCVNPAHLREGTGAHNAADRSLHIAELIRNGGGALRADGVYLETMAKPKLLSYEQVAERAGVSTLTLRNKYMVTARRNRKEGHPRPGDLPEPDLTVGQSPAWFPETIEQWMRHRPGQGKGGGYPAQQRNR